MNKKRIVSTLLAGMLVASTLASCGGDKDKTSSTGKTESGSSASASFNETGYPLTNEDITLNMVYGKNDLTDNLEDNKIFKDLEEKTGVKIAWQYIATDWDQQKSLMLASGELPDAFLGKGNAPIKDMDIMGNVDYFVPMEDLVEKYAPNIKKMFDNDESMKNMSTAPDGHIYSLPQRMPVRPSTFDVGFINQKWLDNLGLAYPTTTEEFKNVLKAFKEQDANGNGDPNDEIPMTFVGTNDLAGFLSLFGAFGLVDSIVDGENGEFLSVTDKKVSFWPTQDSYKDAIKYFNDLSSQGLIDPEVFTQDFGMGTSKYRNEGDSIVGVGFHWTIPAGVGDKHADEYTQLLPMKGPNGDQYWRQNPEKVKGGRNYFEITSVNKYPELTMRWVDELYDEERSLELYFGALGVGLEKTEDGKYQMLPPQDGMTEDSWIWKNSLGDSGPIYVSEEMEEKIVHNSWMDTKLDYDKAYAPYVKEEYYPMVYWTKEQADELAMLKADINKYAKEKMADWITNGGIDEQWDEYIAQMNQMGLERMMEIYQQGYDGYFSK